MKSKKLLATAAISLVAKLVIVGLLFSSGTKAQDYKGRYKDLQTKLAAPAEPSIKGKDVIVTEFGAKGDGVSLCHEALQKAIDKVSASGGGRVIIPEGVWLSGPIELKSHVELHLYRNAILVFSPDKSLYTTKKSQRCLPAISAKGQTDIAITGHGTIDGSGKYWRPVKRSKVSDTEWKEYKKMGGEEAEEGKLWFPYNLKNFNNITDDAKKEEAKRADLFRPTDCKRILLRGVTFQNSPRFHVHPVTCEDIIIDGITVRCPWNAQNGDGIDLSNCRRALICNSTVDVGDDAICMKSGIGESGVKDGPTEDVLVEDCVVYHGHGGFVLGSDCSGGMKRMVVRRLTMSGTDTGLRFKSAVGRGGKTEKIYISDVVMNDIKDEAVTFSCSYVDKKYSVSEGKDGATVKAAPYSPEFSDITIRNVVCREAGVGLLSEGMPDFKAVYDIKMEDCTFFYTEKDRVDDGNCRITLDRVKFVTFDRK
ncbi:MAG: glycoside hydrolase family 28 protein [Bacteroidales bacterium]|nr:glycoside hydrolase family 28 protein [Bacteroidales bacterium]